MKRILEIGTIVITAVFSVASLIRLIPINSEAGIRINSFFSRINGDVLLSSLYLFVIIIFAVIIIGKAICDIKYERKRHSFKPGSKRFNKFFSKWYSKQGDINIISDDLNWTVSDNCTDIFNSLKQKCVSGNKLILYLKKPRADEDYDIYTKELIALGAIIKDAPEALVNSYTYSTLIYMGSVTSVIVRKKNRDKGEKIVFEEIENEYVSGVLTALLEVN